MPHASRQLTGMITSVNKYAELYASKSFIELDHSNENLYIIFNCNQDEHNQVYMNAIPNDQIEFSGAQNLFEWMLPYDIRLRLWDQQYMDAFFDKFNLQWMKQYFDQRRMFSSRETVQLTRDQGLIEQVHELIRMQQPVVRTVRDY